MTQVKITPVEFEECAMMAQVQKYSGSPASTEDITYENIAKLCTVKLFHLTQSFRNRMFVVGDMIARVKYAQLIDSNDIFVSEAYLKDSAVIFWAKTDTAFTYECLGFMTTPDILTAKTQPVEYSDGKVKKRYIVNVEDLESIEPIVQSSRLGHAKKLSLAAALGHTIDTGIVDFERPSSVIARNMIAEEVNGNEISSSKKRTVKKIGGAVDTGEFLKSVWPYAVTSDMLAEKKEISRKAAASRLRRAIDAGVAEVHPLSKRNHPLYLHKQ